MKIVFAVLMAITLFTLSAIPCHADTYYYNPFPAWFIKDILTYHLANFFEACSRAGVLTPHPVVSHFEYKTLSGDVYIWDEISP
jgi:hypothetical protein